MRSDLSKTHRRADGRPLSPHRYWIFGGLFVVLLAWLLLGSQGSLFVQNELEQERESLNLRYQEVIESVERYQKLLSRLEEDDAFLERLVRERLGLAASGERVYVIIDKTKGEDSAKENGSTSVWQAEPVE